MSPTVTNTVPIAVIIPTYNRGLSVCAVLEKIRACNPRPSEIWVHIDLADGVLERELNSRFPEVGVLKSAVRLGPGGGRHRCLSACSTPYAVSFDDDSYPADLDFFSKIEELFAQHQQVAIFAARVWHRHEVEVARSENLLPVGDYIGCGYAVRVAAYRSVRGHLPRAVPYGMEESDLSLQLFASGWHIVQAGELRVFHDTELKHHSSREITAGSITNVGLFAFLHYPLRGWGWGTMQLANKVAYCIRTGRLRGIISGLIRIPYECYQNRQHRKPIPWQTLTIFREFRRLPSSLDAANK